MTYNRLWSMDKYIYCLVLFASSISLFSQNEYFVNKEAGFRIQAPGEFLEKFQQISTEIGIMEVFTYYYQPDSEDAKNFLYLINYIEYPEGALHHDSLAIVEDLFAKSFEEFNISVSGKVIYQTPFLDDSPPNSIFRVEYDNGFNVVKAKMLVHENKFYFLQVFTTKPHSLNKDIDKFLDSFTLYAG